MFRSAKDGGLALANDSNALIQALHGAVTVGDDLSSWGKLVDVLQVTSILSAAAFAGLALFTEYKKKGKITRAGRWAVGGIVLSALLSLATQWGKAEIDRRKSEKANGEQTARLNEEISRFHQQMQGLANLSGQQQKTLIGNGQQMLEMMHLAKQQQNVLAGNRLLSHNMEIALVSQENLRRQAERTRSDIESTRSRVDQAATETLETMWNNANRIEPTGIQVIFSYLCPSPPSGLTDTPPLFDNGAFVEMGLRPAIGVDDHDFREPIAFSPDLAPSSETLIALQREVGSRRIAFYGPNDLMRINTFSLFLPDRFSSSAFHDPEQWRNAGIEVIISARLEMSEAALARRARVWDAKHALEHYSFTSEQLNNPRVRVSRLQCETHVVVKVNGRTIMDDNPQMVLISGWNHFEQPIVLVRTYPHRIPPDIFPYFHRPGQAGR
jgi:hypothetical protein